MTAATLDAPKIASRFAQAGSGHAQAEVLRQAFDERDRALHALQDMVQKLQTADARRDAQHTAGKDDARALQQQMQTLEENARREANERATKGDIALVRKDMEAMEQRLDVRFTKINTRFDVEFVKIDTRFAWTDGKIDLLRKDMDAMENRLVLRLSKIMLAVMGLGVTVIGGMLGLLQFFR